MSISFHAMALFSLEAENFKSAPRADENPHWRGPHQQFSGQP